MAITEYHVQNVLKGYHRKLIRQKMGETSLTLVSSRGTFLMTKNTRHHIERQVASQIRRLLIERTFRG